MVISFFLLEYSYFYEFKLKLPTELNDISIGLPDVLTTLPYSVPLLLLALLDFLLLKNDPKRLPLATPCLFISICYSSVSRTLGETSLVSCLSTSSRPFLYLVMSVGLALLAC